MMLSERQLRGIYGVRARTGARIYFTTDDFWGRAAPLSPLGLWSAPLLIWAHCCRALLDLHAAAQSLAVRAAAAVFREE